MVKIKNPTYEENNQLDLKMVSCCTRHNFSNFDRFAIKIEPRNITLRIRYIKPSQSHNQFAVLHEL